MPMPCPPSAGASAVTCFPWATALRLPILLACLGSATGLLAQFASPDSFSADPPGPPDMPYLLLEVVEIREETGGLDDDENPDIALYEEENETWARELLAVQREMEEIGRDEIEDLGFLEAPSLDSASYTPPARLSRTQLFNGFNPGRVPRASFPIRSQTIGPALATFFGRTTPGGLGNQITLPAGRRKQTHLRAGLATAPSFGAGARQTGALMSSPDATTAFRADASTSWQEGPEDFARSRGGTGGVVVRRETKKGFNQINIAMDHNRSEPSDGLFAARPTAGAKVIGPYLPLAGFNPQGRQAWRSSERAALNFSAERRLPDDLVLRMNTLVGRESSSEFRWRNGQFLIDEAVFGGNREPQFTDSERWGISQGFEAVKRFEWLGLRHRLVGGVEGSYAEGGTQQDLLPQALQQTLPAGMRRLDPANPDFSPLPYDRSSFTRIGADQRDQTFTGGVYVHDRIGLDRGKHFIAFGGRWDQQRVEVQDGRPGAAAPRASAKREAPGAHVAWLTQWVPGRFNTFASWSRSFVPSTRVDLRRSQIVGSETTSGFEGGCFWRSRDGAWQSTLNAYFLQRSDITRPNPLYNDPVADADRTQPQYLSSGEEDFIGTESALSWRSPAGWRAGLRWNIRRAIVTSSPDFPAEVDRQMAGLPRWNASASFGRTIDLGQKRSLDFSASGTWTPDYVIRREDRVWQQVDAEGFLNSSVGASYRWESGKIRHSVSASVRNPLDINNLERVYRLGLDRMLSASWNATF